MYRKILLPVDLHAPASWQKALPIVLDLCTTFGCELHLLAIFPDLPFSMYGLALPEGVAQRLADAAAAELERFEAEHLPPGLCTTRHVAGGRIYQVILDTAAALDVDLIAIASHRPELSDYLIGPNASLVVRHADRSVLVIR
jgi:nucleotide-binding universal stress UspA family protein